MNSVHRFDERKDKLTTDSRRTGDLSTGAIGDSTRLRKLTKELDIIKVRRTGLIEFCIL